MKITNIFFIRHGESFNNCIYKVIFDKFGHDISDERFLIEEGKLRQTDCDLSPRGYEQAEKLGVYAREVGMFPKNIEDNQQQYDNMDYEYEIYSSPMNRCLVTTREFLKGYSASDNHFKVKVNPMLYESGGCYDQISETETIGRKGYSSKEINHLFPGFICDGMDDGWYQKPFMETYDEFLVRADDVYSWILSLHRESRPNLKSRGRNIILFLHGNLICVLLNKLLKSSKVLYVTNNTGVNCLSIQTTEDDREVVAAKYLNRIDHLKTSDLISGGVIVDDHWIQEYLHYVHGL